MIPVLLAAISVASTVASTAAGIISAKKQGKAADSARKAQQVAAQREKVKALRESRIKQALVNQAAEGQGVAGSSGAVGGAQSVASQAYGNISFINRMDQLNQRQHDYMQKAATWNGIGQIAKAVGSISSGIYSVYGKSTKPANPATEIQAY